MSEPYAEILEGESVERLAPGARHELICARLHDALRISLTNVASTRLLPPRSEVKLSRYATVRPDAALVTTATGKIWLAAEIISSDDHRHDTVVKKQIYEELKLPRLWMIDPRYDNVEIYHATEYGMALKGMLAGKDVLNEKLLPEFQMIIARLFAPG